MSLSISFISVSESIIFHLQRRNSRCSAVRRKKLFSSIKLVCETSALIIFSIREFEWSLVRINLLEVRLLYTACSNEIWVRPVQWSCSLDKPWWLQETLFSQYTTKDMWIHIISEYRILFWLIFLNKIYKQ